MLIRLMATILGYHYAIPTTLRHSWFAEIILRCACGKSEITLRYADRLSTSSLSAYHISTSGYSKFGCRKVITKRPTELTEHYGILDSFAMCLRWPLVQRPLLSLKSDALSITSLQCAYALTVTTFQMFN